MGDFESLLEDVSYLVAINQSRQSPDERPDKKSIDLPDPMVSSYVEHVLKENNEMIFENIYKDLIETYFFEEYIKINNINCVQLNTYLDINEYNKTDDQYIKASLLQTFIDNYKVNFLILIDIDNKFCNYNLELEVNDPVRIKTILQEIEAILASNLNKTLFTDFTKSESYLRFLLWKYYELNLKIELDSFFVHRLIGRGGFGEVYGAHHNITGKMYAMKCLDKRKLKESSNKNSFQLALNELALLKELNSDFVICLTYAFQTQDKLFFILDLNEGGDLAYHLKLHKQFDEKTTRFYTSEVILGLEYIHRKGIIFLDLKPENVLLDRTGHSKISDFGLACHVDDSKLSYFIGTNGYRAPEVRTKSYRYTQVADYFSLGCFIIKLLMGHKYGFAYDSKTKGNKERELKAENIPTELNDTVHDLLRGLLCEDPVKRLGGLRGIEEIKIHTFFQGVSWEKMYKRQISPPIVPLSNVVNAEEAGVIGLFKINNKTRLDMKDHEVFDNFYFKHIELYRKEISETILKSTDSAYKRSNQLRIKKILTFKYETNEKCDIICYGSIHEYSIGINTWKRRALILYSGRMEFCTFTKLKLLRLVPIDYEVTVKRITHKGLECIKISKNGKKLVIFKVQSALELRWWWDMINLAYQNATNSMLTITKGYGRNNKMKTSKFSEDNILDRIKVEYHGTIKKYSL